MPKGNPNPSPATRFGAKGGNPTNLGGKTKKQRQAEYEAAEIATKLRQKALSVMLEKVESGEIDPLDVINSDNLRLFKDSEDRAFGTPTSTIAGDPERPLGFSGVTLVPLETEGDDDA